SARSALPAAANAATAGRTPQVGYRCGDAAWRVCRPAPGRRSQNSLHSMKDKCVRWDDAPIARGGVVLHRIPADSHCATIRRMPRPRLRHPLICLRGALIVRKTELIRFNISECERLRLPKSGGRMEGLAYKGYGIRSVTRQVPDTEEWEAEAIILERR